MRQWWLTRGKGNAGTESHQFVVVDFSGGALDFEVPRFEFTIHTYPYISYHIHTWILRFLRRFMKMSSSDIQWSSHCRIAFNIFNLRNLRGMIHSEAASPPWVFQDGHLQRWHPNVPASRLPGCPGGPTGFPGCILLYTLVIYGDIMSYPHIKLFNLYMLLYAIICIYVISDVISIYVNFTEKFAINFRIRTRLSAFPLAMAKSSSPPCDGLGVAPSFQAPALPPKRSVRNCLSEQSVPTAIIGKL